MQRKLSQRATDDPTKQFVDLYSLLCHEVWLRVAHHHVNANQGRETAGIDGETMSNFNGNREGNLEELRQLLKAGTFEPVPVRRVYVPKPKGGERPLGIPTIRDRIVQEGLRMILEPLWEADFSIHSYGFRPNRSTYDAIAYIGNRLTSNGSIYQWIIEGDIASYFDTISHNWLLTHIPMEESILEKSLKAGYMEKSVWHAAEDGTPQGGIISPVLANMTLDGLEKLLREKYPTKGPGGNKGRRSKVHTVRYADDFIITGSSQTLLEKEVKPLVIGFLQERGLELSQEKTKITHIADGFDFLGQNIRKYNGLLLTRPSKKNVKAFLTDIRETIKGHKQATAYGLIALLNPKIQGWANYHRHGASSKTFVRVDWAIEKALWQWAKRRHPKKGTHWIQKRYFCQIGSKNWCFFGTAKSKDGQTVQKVLCTAASTPIVRHTKIKGACNPYDPAWTPYLSERQEAKMKRTLRNRHQLLELWK